MPGYERVEVGEVEDGDIVLDLGGDVIDYRGTITPHMRVYRPKWVWAALFDTEQEARATGKVVRCLR